MSITHYFHRGALALTLVLSAAACGDDDVAQNECGAGTTLVNGECVTDAMCGSGTTLSNGECVSDSTCGAGTILMAGVCVPVAPTTTYRQVEHLGRPGIAEALLITPAFLEGYNATAPSFAGAPATAVAAITAEAKTVLKAIYLGACLLNGVVGFNAANGVHPAGLTCVEVGGNIFTSNTASGTTLKTTVAAGAQAYADQVFGQFETDVLRIDTAVASAYLNLCSGVATSPLLCGGRTLNDDVIDITYFFLLAGAAVPSGATDQATADQSVALVSDGVFFSSTNSENDGIGLGTASPRFGLPNDTNPNQFKQSCANCGTSALTGTFPYSAPPR